MNENGSVQNCVFKLDGQPHKITGNTDGKLTKAQHTFQDGVWTAKIKKVGCPELILERKRVGDEIRTKETLGDIVIESTVVKT